MEIVMSKMGRPSGEAYVTLSDANDYEAAQERHNQHIGTRYVEVFPVREGEYAPKTYESPSNDDGDDCIMRLRGLPFRVTKEEIEDFFGGYDIVSNGIVLPTDHQGRPTGDAFVRFVDKETADRSQERDKEKIGHRYIEIFKSSTLEMNSATFSGSSARYGGGGGGPMGGGSFGGNRPSPYDSRDRFGGANRYGNTRGRGGYDDYNGGGGYGGGSNNGFSSQWGGGRPMRGGGGGGYNRGMDKAGGGHNVHARGLPFRATFDDVCDFFRPVVPINVVFQEDDRGRPSGEADIEFATHEDAVRAMAKDKMNMQYRYIELFLNSEPGDNGHDGGDHGYGRRY